jgi:hypothetical protein
MHRTVLAVVILLTAYSTPVGGQQSATAPAQAVRTTDVKSDSWAGWRFLVGDWVGEGKGAPGQSAGGFSFQFDLQGKVLVRRSHADYPATKDRPAFTHEDLMIVYPGTDSAHAKAVYFDSEGHVIHYNAELSSDQSTLTFLSDAAQPGPRFCLIYNRLSPHSMGIKFEIAPPDKPDDFAVYLTGIVERAPE